MKDPFDSILNCHSSTEALDEVRLQDRLDRLFQYLKQDSWSVREASHIIAGVDPKTDISDAFHSEGEIGVSYLPGIQRPRSNDDRSALALSMEVRIRDVAERLSGIQDVALKPPSKIIDLLIKAGFVPPWLDPAASDEGRCAEYLSKFARGTSPLHIQLTAAEKLQSGGVARARKRDRRRDRAIALYLTTVMSRGVPPHWCKKTSGRLCPTKIGAALWDCDRLPSNPETGEPYDREIVIRAVRRFLNKSLEKDAA